MTRTIFVCCGTGCIANGSLAVADALRAALDETATVYGQGKAAATAGQAERREAAATAGIQVEALVKQTGCNGFCENGPIVKIMPDDISYYKVKPQDAAEIIDSLDKAPVERLLYKDRDGRSLRSQKENPFYAQQMKIVLRNIGEIDPAEIDDYLARGGYAALKKALAMQPAEIIAEVEKSGLRGRGGAGFPTGSKWRIAASYDDFPKYVVMNGDEGDPGAFMDRSILEGDPHCVLEGLAICALAVGAEQGFLYIRDEYGLALRQVQKAIADAGKAGILGNAIMGSEKKLHLEVVRGGGAFVCGESTALMASIEGRPGEPRAKYIRSVQRGLWDKPTVLNNVETLANIPFLILEGGAKFAEKGTANSKGTKVFALVGKVKRTGLIEVPMGVSLRHLIFDIGGGLLSDRPFKAVQTGGPSGGCIPAELLDLPVDFDTLTEKGAMMGSGGMIVMDDRDCMVEMARYYVNFLCGESCGKCTPCREGLRQLRNILTDITEGRGEPEDLQLMEEICDTMRDASLCALGKSAPNPVMTTLRYFREEYESHIRDKTCPAGHCPKLTAFRIDTDKCTGCGRCAGACPGGAISGAIKSPYRIDGSKCLACGVCRDLCRFEAAIAEKAGYEA